MQDDAVSKAYNYIYNAIICGDLPLGSPISEGSVSEALGISRSPVRDAIKLMQAEGLVTHYQSMGTFVTDITKQDLQEIFELRILLETYALRTSIKYIPAEELNTLEQTFLKIDNHPASELVYESNATLHRLIIDYCGNKRLISFYDKLSAQFAIVNKLSSFTHPHFVDTHLKILRSIRNRDISSAEQNLLEHLFEVKERTINNYPIR